MGFLGYGLVSIPKNLFRFSSSQTILRFNRYQAVSLWSVCLYFIYFIYFILLSFFDFFYSFISLIA